MMQVNYFRVLSRSSVCEVVARYQSRTPQLQQFLKQFRVYKLSEPEFLKKCSPLSPPALESREGYRIAMRVANGLNQPDLTLELYRECQRSFLALQPRIIAQFLCAVKLSNNKELLDNNMKTIKEHHHDQRVYHSMIGALGSCFGYSRAENFIQKLKESGINPTVYMNNDLIQFAPVKTGKQILQQMRQESTTNAPNSRSYRNLIANYGYNKKYQSAYNVFTLMQRDRIPPSLSIYEILFEIFISHRDTKAIELLRASMKSHNMLPNAKITEMAILAYANNNKAEKAQDIFNEALQIQQDNQNTNGVQLITAGSYLALLQGFLLRKDLHSCKVVISALRTIDGGDALYSACFEYIALCLEMKDFTLAWEMFQIMKQDFGNLDSDVYQELVAFICNDGDKDSNESYMSEILVEIAGRAIEIEPMQYHRLLHLFVDWDRWDLVTVTIKCMMNYGVSVPRKVYEGLLIQTAQILDPTVIDDIKAYFAAVDQ